MDVLLGILCSGITVKIQIFIFLIALLILIILIKNKQILLPKTISFYIISVFSIVYTFLNYRLSNNFQYSILLGLPSCYYLGYCIQEYFVKNDEKNSKIIFGISGGMFIHALLNFAANFNSTSRNTIDFWTREVSVATIQSTFLTLQLSLLFYNLKFEEKIWKKILYIISVIISFSYIIVIGSRTPIIVAFIVFFSSVIYYYVFLDKKNIRKNLKKIMVGLLTMIVLVLIILLAYKSNVLNIQHSNLFARIGQETTQNSDNSRVKSVLIGLKMIAKYPLGHTEKVGDLNYAHNMWLDAGRDAGIFAFVLLLTYTIFTVMYVIKIAKNKNISNKYKVLLFCVYLGLNLHCFVEPILEGNLGFFLNIVIINGMVDNQSKNSYMEKGRSKS